MVPCFSLYFPFLLSSAASFDSLQKPNVLFSYQFFFPNRAIHENVFPFKCDVCPYQGRTMDLLKVHKRSHLVDKPFKCTQCPKATTTSSNLAKHMRHVHSTTRPFKVITNLCPSYSEGGSGF